MSNLSGVTPRASAATASNRTQLEADTDAFINNKFSTTSAGAPVCPCAFSKEQAHIAQSTTLFSGPTISTVESEKMGELGAVHVLKERLASQGKEFDPTLLHTFEGANSFNMVYFNDHPPNATSAIIVEAKGGSSTLGSRFEDDTKTTRVDQGHPDYAVTLIQVMIAAKGDSDKNVERRKVGRQLRRIVDKPGGGAEVLYIGVATKYNKAKQLVHDPVMIFATNL